ncbi:hypothetical protein [Streptomyces sp. SP17KL33]|uniref:hypothetical protein n=1 Tax=Streptomyces sp. SP17KL33 TaxID=3002534 RepID=UPI002E7A5B46|nr:hypothetical protein [Streptomyces sp. SP17KL33]
MWADHSYLATEITDADKHREIPLTDEEQRLWTDMALAAQRRGELVASWYTADGRSITLAHLTKDDSSVVVALSGDPPAPGWQVIGRYADEVAAHRALPSPVPPGVLRPDVSWLNRPEPAPEVSVQELILDVTEAQAAGDVAEALLTATQHGYQADPLVRLQELLATAGQFANALDTVRGRQVAAQLATLGWHLDFLTQEVRETAENLGARVAVLPPHRTPTPQIHPASSPRHDPSRTPRPRPSSRAAPLEPLPPSAPIQLSEETHDMAVVGTPGYRNVRKGESGSCGAVRPALKRQSLPIVRGPATHR